MRIGFCGYATAGKDVAASALVEHRGFVKVNMSDALQRDLKILDPYIEVLGAHIRVSQALMVYTYDSLKEVSEDYRTLLQRYGTDVWRSVDEEVWVRRANHEADRHDRVVTTGIRFLNEMDGIDYLIYVERPGVGPVNGHVSDAGIQAVIDVADFQLVNDGTPEELQASALALVDELLSDC
jgi:hypothetical protein